MAESELRDLHTDYIDGKGPGVGAAKDYRLGRDSTRRKTIAFLQHELKADAHCSGAVTAVMVLCALHYPTRIILLFFFLPVPIWLFVGFQVVQDAFIFLSQQSSTTAVTVHLAGALFAYGYYKRHWRILRWWAQLRYFLQRSTRPRLRVYREESRQPASVTATDTGSDDLEAKLDAVLDKVAHFGQASLSDSERQILLRASEVYKRRRT